MHTTCALDAITWDDVLEPGTTEINGVTVPGTRRSTGVCRTSTAWTAWSVSPPVQRRGSRGSGGSTTTVPSPPSWSTPSSHRTRTSSPSRRTSITRRWRPSGRCRVPAVFHPAAHDEPALYLSVFRGTFGDADAFCFYTASERTLVERMYTVAERPQIVLGLGVGESEAAGRPGAEVSGLGDRPYIVSVGRVDERRAPEMLARYFAAVQGAASRSAGPRPRRSGLLRVPEHPDIVVTGAVSEADKWDNVPRRPRVGVAIGSRVVLTGGDRGLGGAASRSWSTARAGRPGSTVNARAGACGSPRIPSSRPCCSGSCPTRHCGPSWRRRGRAFVDRHFRWPVLVEQYDEFLTGVVQRGKGAPGLF